MLIKLITSRDYQGIRDPASICLEIHWSIKKHMQGKNVQSVNLFKIMWKLYLSEKFAPYPKYSHQGTLQIYKTPFEITMPNHHSLVKKTEIWSFISLKDPLN